MSPGPIFRSTLEWITVVCAVVGTAVATWQGYLLSRTYLQPFQANRQLQQMDVCAEFVFRAAEFLVSIKLAQLEYGKPVAGAKVAPDSDLLPQQTRREVAENVRQLDVAMARLKFYADPTTVIDILGLEVAQVVMLTYLAPDEGVASKDKFHEASKEYSDALDKVQADCKKVISGEAVGDI